MEIIEVSSKEYAMVIIHTLFIYAGIEFNNLNSYKCDSIQYLLFKDTHFRMGIIGGIKENIFQSPFSASFGGFSFQREDIRLEYIDNALDSLIEWVKIKNLSGINLTLPPFFYSESQISKLTNCLFRKSFRIAKIDLNYHFNLQKLDETYINHIWKEARNNLRKAFLNKLTFNYCSSSEEKEIAYEIIRQNKEINGYTLFLDLNQIIETAKIVNCDFFLVRDINFHPIASAIVYHVSIEIVQVIYWGDLCEYRNLRAMNFLSYKIFEYYKIIGKKIVDLGPSTNCSIPNYGLSVFKESIGCEMTTKFSFSLRC
jgi:hypothetical protein